MSEPLTPRESARQVRAMVRDIGFYLENLTDGAALDTAKISPGGNGARILRSKDGKLLAEFQDAQLADFVRRAPDWLTFMVNHVKQVERIAFEQRARKRKLERVVQAFGKAADAGFQTSTGRYYLDEARQALFAPESDDD